MKTKDKQLSEYLEKIKQDNNLRKANKIYLQSLNDLGIIVFESGEKNERRINTK